MSEQPILDIVDYCVAEAKKKGAAAADAVIFSSSEVNVRQRLGKLETLERAEARGVGIRVFMEGENGLRQATVSTSDMRKEALETMVDHVVAMAKISPADPHIGLADPSLMVSELVDLDVLDKNEYSEKQLIEMASEAEEAALAVKVVMNSEGADIGYGVSSVAMANSHGLAATYDNSSFSFSASVVAGEGVEMETDYAYSMARHWADLKNATKLGNEAGERAVKKLAPRKVKTCQVPVIFDVRESRSLLRAFEKAILGSSVARGSSFLQDFMGKQVFADGITVVDNPLLKRGAASEPFDGEGVQGKERYLVKDGVLQSWLLDVRSANQLGLQTTGHASRSLSGSPSPASTNLYMENGDVSVADLIGDIESGFYVTDTFGMGVNGVTGDYSQGAAGFWIEKGQIAYPVSEVTIASNLKDMFMRMALANDLEREFGLDAPTIRVEGMTIAGS